MRDIFIGIAIGGVLTCIALACSWLIYEAIQDIFNPKD